MADSTDTTTRSTREDYDLIERPDPVELLHYAEGVLGFITVCSAEAGGMMELPTGGLVTQNAIDGAVALITLARKEVERQQSLPRHFTPEGR
jgi:hypothetical protein